tara:strand:+ start:430 stop:1167 length:738 start_codon:yes stop_codon:yes gene_type:complete
MLEEIYIYFILFLLVILQSIAGVGVLVVGTPTFLIFNYGIVEILSMLLPISILTSFINLLIFLFYKKNNHLTIDKEYKILFYSLCFPSIIIGLIILKNFKNYFNFGYLVSFIIFFSILATNYKKFFFIINKKIKIIFLIFTGIIHGLTNAGGTLLSLFLSSYLNKDQSRYNITYFYFFLATFQYIIFYIVFEKKLYNFDIFLLIPILLLGVSIGNFVANYFKNTSFRVLINLLSLIVCFVLLIKS